MLYVNDDNYVIYAAHFYDNPSCATQKEFEEDIGRVKFIHKMFKRYAKDGTINERLVLNHLILIYNVFERKAATRMLVLKLGKYLHILKPFLIQLSFWPEKIDNVGSVGSVILSSDIPMDPVLIDRLRRI